ncbi:MAG TPA: rhodanese-like domain-containing protein [Vicinamibacterales bacterium]|nr:rhodanese-like domain-containing protein [Vicinamibacterales bacterium]
MTHAQGLTPQQIRHLIESGTRLRFIDARDHIVWASSTAKIPGAIRVPPELTDEHVATLPLDRLLITYGSGDDDGRAADVAKVLNARGFTASYLHGGFGAWLGAGLPVGPR